jgi:hypothetical protein
MHEGAKSDTLSVFGEVMNHHRTDEQLEAILAETGEWAVVGTNDQLLCLGASLRHAIDLALDEMFGERIVIALARRPSDRTVVFMDQMFRIWEGVIRRERPVEYEAIFTL